MIINIRKCTIPEHPQHHGRQRISPLGGQNIGFLYTELRHNHQDHDKEGIDATEHHILCHH